MAEKEVRLIDANALTEDVLNSFTKSNGMRDAFIKHIQFSPTIDPESLRARGKWLICSDGYYPYCSECKKEPKGGNMTSYCPNCGAKMEGDSYD